MGRLVRVCVRVGLLLAIPACSHAPAEPSPMPEPAPVFGEAQPLSCDGTLAAIIGDRGIDMAAFDDIYGPLRAKYDEAGEQMPEDLDARYHLDISEGVIYREVLALELAKLGLEIDATELENREPSNLELEDLRERALLEAAGPLAVSEAEIVAHYERVAPELVTDVPRFRAAHILIKIDEDTSVAEALATAQAIYELAIQPDADFAQLARERSEARDARFDGGVWMFSPDSVEPSFATAALALKSGEVSRPFRTKRGYELLKVYQAWGPGQPPPFEALEPQIRKSLLRAKREQSVRALRARLREDYKPINCVRVLAESRGLEWDDSLAEPISVPPS